MQHVITKIMNPQPLHSLYRFLKIDPQRFLLLCGDCAFVSVSVLNELTCLFAVHLGCLMKIAERSCITAAVTNEG